VASQRDTECEIESRGELHAMRCAHCHGTPDSDIAAGTILIGWCTRIGRAVHGRHRRHTHGIRSLHRRQSEPGADENGKDGAEKLHAHNLDGRRYGALGDR
jgi:hypothetical protein